MAIYRKSRFERGEVYYDEENDIDFLAPVETDVIRDESDFIYTFRAGDRLDLLADEFYGDPKLRWIILYANPQITSEFDLRVGDTIVIPNPQRSDLY